MMSSILEQHYVGVLTYSGAYASCTIANIKQAMKACYKFCYNIKMFRPFCIGVIYPEHSLAQPKNALKAYF